MKTELCLSSRSVDLVDSMLSRSKTALPEATEFGCVNGSSFNKDFGEVSSTMRVQL